MINQTQLKSIINYDEYTGKVTRGARQLGSYDVNGYLVTSINNKGYKLHRLIWLYMTGSFPEKHIDHINGVRDDNRWCNLREANDRENGRNRKLPNKNNKVGHKNIVSRKYSWIIAISDNGKPFRKTLAKSRYSLEEALLIRDSLLKELHGSFANSETINV